MAIKRPVECTECVYFLQALLESNVFCPRFSLHEDPHRMCMNEAEWAVSTKYKRKPQAEKDRESQHLRQVPVWCHSYSKAGSSWGFQRLQPQVTPAD